MERTHISSKLSPWVISTTLVFSCLAIASTTNAQEEGIYHERLEYDAESGDWVTIAPPVPGTDGGDLSIARSLLARGEYRNARKSFDKWFETYPDSPLWSESLFYAAETEILAEDAKQKRGDLIQAYEWLEELLEAWPGTALADRALRKERIIAEMLLFKDHKQRLWGGVLWLSATEEALDMLNRIVDLWAAGKPIAEDSLRLKADYHYEHGQFEEAEIAYARLMREFPKGRYHKIAMLQSGHSAMARFPGTEFDDADLLEAEVYFRDFQNRYPREAAAHDVPLELDRITESLARKEYSIGQFYERTRAIDAAVYYYRWLVDHYPQTTWAAEAEYRLIALGAEEPEEFNAADSTAMEFPDELDD